MNTLRSIGLISVATLLLGTGIACESWGRRSSNSEPALSRVSLTLEPSTRELVVGETVTITARSEDTYGRDSDLEWMTTSGKLSTEENGRIARVKFDQPGMYTVSAVLSVEGRETRRATVEIRVKPLT